GRAFDTLLTLIEARGTVLSKDELMSRVWPDQVVEENSLAAQIHVLRKVSGADRHLIPVRPPSATSETAAGPPLARMTNLPEVVSELIGREAELGAVAAMV